MSTSSKPASILSSGYIKLKLKSVTNKTERKRTCEEFLRRMQTQREAQKKSRSNIEDTDDVIRFLKAELEYLKG